MQFFKFAFAALAVVTAAVSVPNGDSSSLANRQAGDPALQEKHLFPRQKHGNGSCSPTCKHYNCCYNEGTPNEWCRCGWDLLQALETNNVTISPDSKNLVVDISSISMPTTGLEVGLDPPQNHCNARCKRRHCCTNRFKLCHCRAELLDALDANEAFELESVISPGCSAECLHRKGCCIANDKGLFCRCPPETLEALDARAITLDTRESNPNALALADPKKVAVNDISIPNLHARYSRGCSPECARRHCCAITHFGNFCRCMDALLEALAANEALTPAISAHEASSLNVRKLTSRELAEDAGSIPEVDSTNLCSKACLLHRGCCVGDAHRRACICSAEVLEARNAKAALTSAISAHEASPLNVRERDSEDLAVDVGSILEVDSTNLCSEACRHREGCCVGNGRRKWCVCSAEVLEALDTREDFTPAISAQESSTLDAREAAPEAPAVTNTEDGKCDDRCLEYGCCFKIGVLGTCRCSPRLLDDFDALNNVTFVRENFVLPNHTGN